MNFTTNFADQEIPCIAELSVDDVPRGQRARRVVELCHDGLGRAVRLPVLIVRGRKAGPIFGLTSALHGDELNGIPVVHRLVEKLDPTKLRGTVVACPVMNIPGFLNNKRKYRDGKDLNHLMPGIHNGNESEAYASRLFERVVSRFEVLVDLHTASFGRVNSLYVRADMENPVTARMAMLQRPKIILHNPASDYTLRGAAAEMGIPAITIEVGDPQVFQPRHIRPTLAGVRAVMCHFGMLKKRPYVENSAPIVCRSSRWLFTDQGGLLTVLPDLAEPVEKGQLIAFQKDVFGDMVREYHAPSDGVVIGKSVNPVAPTGARILHLGAVANPGSGLPTSAASQSLQEEAG